METGRWHERETVDVSCGKVVEPRTGHRVCVTEDVESFHPLLTRFFRPIPWCNQRDVSVEEVSGARRFVGIEPPVLGLRRRDNVELLKQFYRGPGLVGGVIIGRLSERQRRENLNEEEGDEHQGGSAALPLHALPTSGNLIKDWL